MGSVAGQRARSGARGGRTEAAAFAAAAALLRALSHPARLRIVSLLSGGELCVKRIEEALGIPQPAVSQHLSRLRYAGLIESERRGHLVCYRLVPGRASAVLAAVLGAGGHAKGA